MAGGRRQPGPLGRASVAVVTGASSGIGRVTALMLAEQGTTVVLAARRADELESLKAAIEEEGGRATAVPADVGRLEDVERIVSEAVSEHGRLDALVNVAGIGGGHSIMTDDEYAQRILAVNLLAPARLMRAAVPVMRDQGHGAIVNIGSVAGEIGVQGLYSATKFGLRGLTDSVRRELAGTGITVTLIEPGYIATPLTAERRQRMPGPEIVARAVLEALRRPRRKIVVPAYYRGAVVLSAAFPAVVDRVFAGKPGRGSR